MCSASPRAVGTRTRRKSDLAFGGRSGCLNSFNLNSSRFFYFINYIRFVIILLINVDHGLAPFDLLPAKMFLHHPVVSQSLLL